MEEEVEFPHDQARLYLCTATSIRIKINNYTAAYRRFYNPEEMGKNTVNNYGKDNVGRKAGATETRRRMHR